MFSEQTLLEKAKVAFSFTGKPYEASLCEGSGYKCFMVQTKNEDFLVIQGSGPFFETLEGRQAGDLKLCPLSHDNRLVVNRNLPFTAPVAVLHHKATFGFGDRLGIANTAHIQAAEKTCVIPVLAQQSMRELKLTNRTYDDVLDAAAWSVLRTGWKHGYGADADHLKTKEDISDALARGYSMITLDCSDFLEKLPSDAAEIETAYKNFDPDIRFQYEKRYLESGADTAALVKFDKDSLMRAVITYHKAVNFITEIYKELITTSERPLDYEVSIDETSKKTELTDHVFVAAELKHRGVKIDSLAPRFIGEFQKGIDYIGDLDAFTEDIRSHYAAASFFGYKISVHSGSDKFKVFRAIARETQGRFHIKTSGTSWLEAVKVIADCDPALYRRMHLCALGNFDQSRSFYAVDCDPARITSLSDVSDKDLAAYMEQDDGRQLLHIAYGVISNEKSIRGELFEALKKFSGKYNEAVFSHMKRHLSLLTGS